MENFDKNKWKSLLALKGISQKKMAEKIGINPATLIHKIKNPDAFTISEIKKIGNEIGRKKTIDLFFLGESSETEHAGETANETKH